MSKQIAITDSFLQSVFKLNSQDKKLAFSTAKQLSENPTASSLHMHSIDREKCDKKFLSARINRDLRMILVKRGEVCTLLYVGHHDDAYDWCEGKYLVKTDFGAEYIYDAIFAENKIETLQHEPAIPEYLKVTKSEPLFEKARIKQKELEKIGIQPIHAANLMGIDTEEKLLEYIEIFPEELQESLIDLATQSKSFDLVYNSLVEEANNAGASLHNMRRFYLTEDMDELEKLMENEDFEKWTLFLHPSQEQLVDYNCNGPLLIEGGPGTGKTIVGIHRAVRLAKEMYPAKDGKKILFCTFSKRLANNIAQKIKRLSDIKGIANNIECMGVDSYVARMLGRQALHIDLDAIKAIIKDVFSSRQWRYSLEFFIQEYYEIVEKYHICSCEEYLRVRRKGSGFGLNPSMRKELWSFFESVLEEKKKRNAFSFVDRAFQFKELLDDESIEKKYDSVIIDEAQDLEPIKLRVLCESVKNERNGACILSDRNQRIFRLENWASDAGINVAGRTFYLRINYRTTKQINEYARTQFAKFEMSPADKDYISITSGENPEIISCQSESEENRVIFGKIKEILQVYKPGEICILAPTYEKLYAIKAVLEYEGMRPLLFTGDDITLSENRVNLCTTSGVKGLEFSAIVIAAFNHIGTQRQNYGSATEAELNYEKLVECEKYVAVTRARDKVIITYLGE